MISATFYKAGIIALKTLVFLAALIMFLLFIAVGTEFGSSWSVKQALRVASEGSGYRLSVETVEGTLLDQLGLENLSADPVDVTAPSILVGTLSLEWSPFDLLDGTLMMDDLQMRQIVVDSGQVAAAPVDAEPFDIDAILGTVFSLPVAIRVEQLGIQNITLRTREQSQRIVNVALSGSLDAQALDLLLSVGRDASTSASASLRLEAGSHDLEALIDWQTRVAEMPASGRLSVKGNPAQLQLEHALGAPVVINSGGIITTGLLDGSIPAVDLQHDVSAVNGADFSFPMLLSLSGIITTSGTVEQLLLRGDMEAGLEQLQQTFINFDVIYASSNVQINSAHLESERLTASVSGNVNLADGNAVNLEWILENFTDGDLLPDLELVSLSGNGTINMTTVNDQVSTALSINELVGEINSYPLSGVGEVALLGDQVESIDVEVSAGSNALKLTGTVMPALALDWVLQAPRLDRILTNLQGHASGQGTLAGNTQMPQLNGSLSGGDISYTSDGTRLQLNTLEANARYDGSDNQLSLNFSDLSVDMQGNNLLISRGEVNGSGTLPDHSVSLDVSSSLLDLQMQAVGGYQEETWNGAVPLLALQSDYGDWQLTDPLAISASAEQATLAQHCWAMTSITLCGQALWQSAAGLQGELAVDNLPLAFFNDRDLLVSAGLDEIAVAMDRMPPGLESLLGEFNIQLPPNSFVDGQVDLDSVFTGVGGDWASTTLSLVASPRDLVLGVVTTPAPEADSAMPEVNSYGLDEVLLDVSRENGAWTLDTGFQVYIPEAGGLDFQGSFTGQARLDDEENLAGQFSINFSNIAWLEALVPNVLNPAGVLNATGSIGGALERPLLVFDSRLEDASFELPEYGLQLHDINLSLHSEQDNEITINGEAVSGDGGVTFNSVLTTPFLSTRTLRLEVVGENFQVIDIPDTRVAVNPDLRITYLNNAVDIQGSLDVPLLDLDLSNNLSLVGNGTVGYSRDVVVVSAPPELADSLESASDDPLNNIPLTVEVMLNLGEQVRFRGYGLDLALTGGLMLEQSMDRPLLAQGELLIPAGNYALYGQRLMIENGKLIFLGNPLNPAVDIRAFRDTPNAQVGLLLGGTISNLQGQLFSTPALPEGEILALLITGRSFQNIGNQEGNNMLGAIANLGLEKGQGLTNVVRNGLGLDTVAISTGPDYRDSALGLGKYVSPRLFIRYDIGLFDRDNVLSMDYTLTERLKLGVESGVSQSVDLTYSVEK